MSASIKIKPMRLAHLEKVCLIEREVHKPNYWSRTSFVNELNNPSSVYWVALLCTNEDEELIGYTGLTNVLGEGHITNLAVSPKWQGYKFGEFLLNHLIAEALKWKLEALTLEVRAGNKIAQSLYTKYNFLSHGIRPHYYKDNHEDALIMWSPNIRSSEFKQFMKELSIKLNEQLELKLTSI
jgi:ribosomal-protein-alanine N-acetyltransferase